jgi:nitrogen regulatory protein P-II 1
MKKVEAIIRPERLSRVKKALDEKGFYGMTVLEVRGRGAQKGIQLQYRGKTITVDLIPKMMIIMVIEDDEVDTVIAAIRSEGRTGKNGDGKIFISPIDMVANVRTN